MSPLLIGFLGFMLVLILMALGMPIAFSMLTVGFLGIYHLTGLDVALESIARIPFYWTTVYIFMCCPLFILMGFVYARSGLARELYAVAYKWLGRAPGGLALATVASCGMFAAVSGTSTAGAAAMSPIVYPEMKRYNYDKGLAAGTIAAGGTLGGMIPPSVGFIVYALLTEASIGQLFMGGIIPGIVEILFYFGAIIILVKIKPHLAPQAQITVSWKEKIICLKDVWPALTLFLIVLGGIYTGLFTPVEASAIGAAVAILITVAMRRLSLHSLVLSVLDSARVTVMIFMLVMGAMVFNVFLALSQLPQALSEILGGIGSPGAVVAIILLLYLPMGAFMDTTGMYILTIPLYLPTLIANDINLIWFGILALRCMEIALISPPIGMNVFIVTGIVKDISVEKAFRGIVPFLIADLFILATLALFPQLTLFLPGLMRKF